MIRVKTSMRPVELFGFAAARTLRGRSSRSSSSTTVTVPGSRMHADREVDLVRRLGTDPVQHAAALPGQEARPDAPCPSAEPKIEARGLQDGRRIRRRGRTGDGARREQRLDLVGGEEARREARGFNHVIGSVGVRR